MNQIAVTTAITNRYDHPREDVFVDGVDYLFFCDEESADLAQDWEPIQFPAFTGHPRRLAKKPKLDPHHFDRLREYEYVIWVDGGVHITSPDFVDEIIEHVDKGIVLSPHFDGRRDAYGEATIRPKKYQSEPLDAQIEFYRQQGFPGNNGLYECGVMARRMSEENVQALGEFWHMQVSIWSYQDQVSLPYCLWQMDYEPDVLPKSFRDMEWVNVNAHRSED